MPQRHGTCQFVSPGSANRGDLLALLTPGPSLVEDFFNKRIIRIQLGDWSPRPAFSKAVSLDTGHCTETHHGTRHPLSKTPTTPVGLHWEQPTSRRWTVNSGCFRNKSHLRPCCCCEHLWERPCIARGTGSDSRSGELSFEANKCQKSWSAFYAQASCSFSICFATVCGRSACLANTWTFPCWECFSTSGISSSAIGRQHPPFPDRLVWTLIFKLITGFDIPSTTPTIHVDLAG